MTALPSESHTSHSALRNRVSVAVAPHQAHLGGGGGPTVVGGGGVSVLLIFEYDLLMHRLQLAYDLLHVQN